MDENAPEPMTLADFNERVMKPLTARIAQNFIADQERWEKEREFWFGPIKPPTRWQKLSYPFRRAWQNVRDASLVLVGKKEASDPYDH